MKEKLNERFFKKLLSELNYEATKPLMDDFENKLNSIKILNKESFYEIGRLEKQAIKDIVNFDTDAYVDGKLQELINLCNKKIQDITNETGLNKWLEKGKGKNDPTLSYIKS